ncbi:MAG: IS66 family transposase, partial [Planctomycetaceae bacterium]|nr:IS66 family transposase [Planctomycetaceae bacterium]
MNSTTCETHARPLLDELKAWLDSQSFLLKSLIGKAATYTRNQWDGLNCHLDSGEYLDSGELSLNNNRGERAMKPVAIGRKNWLLVGSPLAGRRSPVLMSLVGSRKENQVDPWAYLRSVFTDLPRGAGHEDLLPDRWLAANPT